MKRLLSIDKPALRWIWQLLRVDRWLMFLLILLQTGSGILITWRSLVLKQVIDHAAGKDQTQFLWKLLFLIGLFLIQLAMMSLYRYFEAFTQYGMEMRLKRRLYQTLLGKEFAAVKSVHSGQWNQRMTSDTSTVASLSVGIVPGFTGLMIRAVGALIVLLYLLPTLVVLLIPFGICLLGATMFLRKTSKRMYHDIQDADGRFRVFLQEHLNNLLMIRAFGKEEASLLEGDRIMEEHKAKIMRRNSFMILVGGFASLAMNAMYLLGVVLGGYGILKGNITYGTFSAVIALASQAQGQIVGVSGYLSNIFNLTASAERLMAAEVFPDDSPSVVRSAAEINEFYCSDFQELLLENAAFSYHNTEEGEPVETKVFENLNLRVQKGEFIAFTGESGCGKSSVLKLLLSIYSLDAGERLLLDRNLKRTELDASWRGLFAYVPQGNCLMYGSIQDVIAFGNPIDEEKMKLSLQIACADQFVQELENGLNTVLGEHGSGLSEGQMQRISIARAIYADCPILLLDESTSALDMETERNVLQNIRRLTDKTVLIVTHRPAALEICDRVIVFETEEQ